jgi:hypothetical protein
MPMQWHENLLSTQKTYLLQKPGWSQPREIKLIFPDSGKIEISKL